MLKDIKSNYFPDTNKRTFFYGFKIFCFVYDYGDL